MVLTKESLLDSNTKIAFVGGGNMAKAMLSGLMEKVTDVDEVAWAKYGIFARHPDTKDWPIGHGFAFYKLNIKNIYVIDYFGGATKHLNVTEYLSYKRPSWM